MSSLESFYRGALAATPDPATYYRRRYLCASPSGGGKGKRHPGKAILAGMGLFSISSYLSNLSLQNIVSECNGEDEYLFILTSMCPNIGKLALLRDPCEYQ